MKIKTLLTVTGVTLGGIGLLAHRHYWHEQLPKQRYRQLQAMMQTRGQISGGWINHHPIAVLHADVLGPGYIGGLIVDHQLFAFTVAADGTLLRWEAI